MTRKSINIQSEGDLVLRLKEFLESLKTGDETAYTSSELMEVLGVSQPTLKKLLKALQRSGKLRPTKKVVVAIDGRRVTVPAYKFDLNSLD